MNTDKIATETPEEAKEFDIMSKQKGGNLSNLIASSEPDEVEVFGLYNGEIELTDPVVAELHKERDELKERCSDLELQLDRVEQKVAEWDGEGLPPVGTACQYKERGGVSWCDCKIIATHDNKIWIENLDRGTCPIGRIGKYEFRVFDPAIYTKPVMQMFGDAEQYIEESWVNGKSCSSEVDSTIRFAKKLHDAGYRKQD